MDLTLQESITRLAGALLRRDVEFVLGCRQLVALLHRLAPEVRDHPAFLTIRGIESELDDFPVSEERLTWAPAALASLDRERDEYIARVEEVLFGACREIQAGAPWV